MTTTTAPTAAALDAVMAMLELRADSAEKAFDRAGEAIMRLHATDAGSAAIREANEALAQARARAMEANDALNAARDFHAG